MSLLSVLRKYSKDQPRVPAGSPKGGEFASRDGGVSADQIHSTIYGSRPLEWYMGSGHDAINGILRGHGQFSVKERLRAEDAINAIDAKFATDAERPPSFLFRGVDYQANQRTLKSMKVGATFTDKGFVSATRDIGTATNFTSMGGAVIQIANNARSRTIRGSQPEAEHIYPRGSKFRLVGKHPWFNAAKGHNRLADDPGWPDPDGEFEGRDVYVVEHVA